MESPYTEETNLVSISPEVVLAPDVLVRVLSAVFESRQVFPVFPMFVPEIIGIDASDE